MLSKRAPLALIILDGWGVSPEREGNAIALARTPTYDDLLRRFAHTELVTSGEAVGLPAGQMGNSEVGHMNMGAGRIVYQELTRIDESIREGEFFANEALLMAMDRCASGKHALHLIGLVSNGGVHSHERHLAALIDLASRRKVPRVFVHALTDGRDTSPSGAATFVSTIEALMNRQGTGRVASVSGRYFAMDRDGRWDRTALAYDALVGISQRTSRHAVHLIQDAYAAGITDEFIRPSVTVDEAGRAIGPLEEDDSVILFNFRADRMRQLTRALSSRTLETFNRRRHPRVHCTTFTLYDAALGLPVAFLPQTFSGNVAEVLASAGLTSLRLAETEKYAHVTYFFNCGEERPYHGEDRILVPSPKVATYDLQPAMSAEAITDQLVADLSSHAHDVIICNFASADMVGHTGKLGATIASVETLDRCLARILAQLEATNGCALVTADHGNAEQMIDPETGGPHTAHTSNPVPFILVGPERRTDRRRSGRLRGGGSLRDVAPTMLGILEIEPPPQMTGHDLRSL